MRPELRQGIGRTQMRDPKRYLLGRDGGLLSGGVLADAPRQESAERDHAAVNHEFSTVHLLPLLRCLSIDGSHAADFLSRSSPPRQTRSTSSLSLSATRSARKPGTICPS